LALLARNKLSGFRVETSQQASAYADHFKLAIIRLINYTPEYARMLSVGTHRVMALHTELSKT